SLGGDMIKHLHDLFLSQPLHFGKVFGLAAVVVIGQARVQLVWMPVDIHVLRVLERLDTLFEAAPADEAPRAGNVREDVNADSLVLRGWGSCIFAHAGITTFAPLAFRILGCPVRGG